MLINIIIALYNNKWLQNVLPLYGMDGLEVNHGEYMVVIGLNWYLYNGKKACLGMELKFLLFA